MHLNVEFSLRSLLVKRIYPADVRLVRNDSKTANLVHDYVNSIADQVNSERDTSEMKLSKAQELMFTIRPLVGLSESTIRKYIAELWLDEIGIRNRFKVDSSEYDNYDERRY